MRSEKITKHICTLKLIRTLVKRLSIHLIYLASILSFNQACAPQSWLNEAQSHSHLGRWEQALQRYEDNLISGAHYHNHPDLRTQQITRGSELAVEQLFNDYKQSFVRSLSSPNKVPACLEFSRLYSLYPLAPELESVHHDLEWFSQYSDKSKGNEDKAVPHFQLENLEDHHLQEAISLLLHDSEKLMYRLMEQEDFYTQCPWAEFDWQQNYDSHRSLHAQLNNLTTAMLESKNRQLNTDTNLLKAIKRLSYLAEAFLKRKRSFSIFFKDEAQALQDKLDHVYSSIWNNYSFQELKRQNWGSAWWFKQLSFLPNSILASQTTDLKEILSLADQSVVDKLEKVRKVLSTSDYLMQNEELHNLNIVQEKEISSKYSGLYDRTPTYLKLKESKIKCSLSTKKQSQELRDVAETKQVTAPQYLVALKRVETLQGQLESALSQRERLESSILIAQSELEAIDQVQLKQQHQAYQVLVQQKVVLNDELKMEKARLDQEQGLMGPPSHEDLEIYDRIRMEVKRLTEQIEKKEMNVEIAKSAWEDAEEHLLQRRREVSRLAGYLTKTVIEVEKRSAELDQKEIDLALIPKTKNEKVYTVFRYPLNEHKLSCRLAWTVLPKGSMQNHLQAGPPPILWYAEEEVSEVEISHKAYRRYGIKAVSFSKKKLKSKLIKKLKLQMKKHFELWLSRARQKQLVLRGQALVRKQENNINFELLAFLTYVSPTHFLDHFYKHLSIKLNDPVPFLIQ